MTRSTLQRFGATCAWLAASGWLAVLALALAGQDRPIVQQTALCWTLTATALATAGAMLAGGERLRSPELTALARPAGVGAALVIALSGAALAVSGPLLAQADAAQAGALLLDRWLQAVAEAWLGLLGFGLLAAWTGLAGLAILRSGDLSRHLGWTAWLVALSQLVLALNSILNPAPLFHAGPGLAALLATPLWLAWLGWELLQPLGKPAQRRLFTSQRQPLDLKEAKHEALRGVARQAQALAWWQRAITRGWRLGLAIWMPWLKRPFSRLINLTRPAVVWQPLNFATLEEYAGWLSQHARWVPDPLGGAFDFFPNLGHAAWQLISQGEFSDDCDGLAYFSSALIEPFCDRPEQRYLVTVLIDPWDVGWANAAHVMLFFKRDGQWRIISNQYLYEPRWETFLDALETNAYVGGRPVLYAVVQDVRLRTLWRGKPGPDDGRPVALQ